MKGLLALLVATIAIAATVPVVEMRREAPGRFEIIVRCRETPPKEAP